MGDLLPWNLSGSYLEACNCEAICPCRTIGGRKGGRSTEGICLGTLSWAIESGRAGGTDLSGLNVVLANRYDDDEPGSPWQLLALSRRARRRAPARGADRDLPRKPRRHAAEAVPVGLQVKRLPGRAHRPDRDRPHAGQGLVSRRRRRHGPDPRAGRRPGAHHLHHPRPSPAGQGAVRRDAVRERRAARVRVQRQVRATRPTSRTPRTTSRASGRGSEMEAAGTAPASAVPAPMRLRAFPQSPISASGSVDPRGTSPAPHPPENVPLRSRVLPSG